MTMSALRIATRQLTKNNNLTLLSVSKTLHQSSLRINNPFLILLQQSLQIRRNSSTTAPITNNTGSSTDVSPKPLKSGNSNPLLDFSRTKVTNQQFSDQNELPLFLAITKSASDKLNSLAKEENNDKLGIRISVESGGCHGFQYNLKLVDNIEDEFKPTEEDSMFMRSGARVVIDKTSLEILRDSKVDYAHELIGSQFKVVDSPYTKSSCGCGSSFDFDFDKLEQDSN